MRKLFIEFSAVVAFIILATASTLGATGITPRLAPLATWSGVVFWIVVAVLFVFELVDEHWPRKKQ